MEQKIFKFEPKSLDTAGTFEGMLSPYNRVDLGGDMVMPGAFTRTIEENGGRVPLLLGHDQNVILGDLGLYDTAEGLRVKGTLDMDLAAARDTYTNLTKRRLRGLSIGYRSLKAKMEGGIRKLSEIQLFEGSLCLFPMEPTAQVSSVKVQDEVLHQLLRTFSLFGGAR